MPVIGKLDTQVNDILIAPLANSNAAAHEDYRENVAPQSERARSPDNATSEIATNETAHTEKMRGAQASLPVWLL